MTSNYFDEDMSGMIRIDLSVDEYKNKIDLNQTININSLVKMKIYYNFDEYSENCLLNQIKLLHPLKMKLKKY